MLIRPSLPPELRERYERCVEALDAPVRTVVDERLWEQEDEGENYSARFARMRQAAIDEHLLDEEWVLWVDADISFPPDLFERLAATASDAVVGAYVRIEDTETNYDTAGTRPIFGARSEISRPAEPVVEMYAVGGCVLVPADVHRQVRFEAQPDDDLTANTEWTSLCIGARALGLRVLWNTTISVEHAFLPNYGEWWH